VLDRFPSFPHPKRGNVILCEKKTSGYLSSTGFPAFRSARVDSLRQGILRILSASRRASSRERVGIRQMVPQERETERE
jgi:hypothetical protein